MSHDRARRHLPEFVSRTAMGWLAPGVIPNGTGRKLLVGVAVWNRYDLQLLDHLADALAAGIGADTVVTVFDVDAVTGPADMERIIPGVGPVLQTPAVGFWDAGIFQEVGTGFFGRQLVARVLGLDEASAHPPLLAAR